MIYTFAFRIHVVISAITLVAGIVTILLSVRGLVRNGEYGRADRWSSLAFYIALYLQLVLGFLIYVTLRSSMGGSLWEVADTENDASLRFWAIEHIALMIFALFLTQLGRIFIRRTTSPKRKFRASLFYYGTSLALILFSMSIALFFR
jgi:hypothetical protein